MEIQANQNNKRSIWTRVVLVLLALAFMLSAAAAVAYLRYIYPTGEIMPGIYAVRIDRNNVPMGNFFLMQIGEKYIAIDAGADNAQTEKGLHKLGILADDVIAVFITHSHWDHVGSLSLFDKADVFSGDTKNSEFPDRIHCIMPDYETIELSGLSIQCIYTPGHTIDSVCYLIDGKYLFAGDLFVTINDPPPPNPRRYDKELQLSYREKILGVEGVEYVFTGHFGFFKNIWFFRWWFK